MEQTRTPNPDGRYRGLGESNLSALDIKRGFTLKRGILEALAECRTSKAPAWRFVSGQGVQIRAYPSNSGILFDFFGGPLQGRTLDEGLAVLLAYQQEGE